MLSVSKLSGRILGQNNHTYKNINDLQLPQTDKTHLGTMSLPSITLVMKALV